MTIGTVQNQVNIRIWLLSHWSRDTGKFVNEQWLSYDAPGTPHRRHFPQMVGGHKQFEAESRYRHLLDCDIGVFIPKSLLYLRRSTDTVSTSAIAQIAIYIEKCTKIKSLHPILCNRILTIEIIEIIEIIDMAAQTEKHYLLSRPHFESMLHATCAIWKRFANRMQVHRSSPK